MRLGSFATAVLIFALGGWLSALANEPATKPGSPDGLRDLFNRLCVSKFPGYANIRDTLGKEGFRPVEDTTLSTDEFLGQRANDSTILLSDLSDVGVVSCSLVRLIGGVGAAASDAVVKCIEQMDVSEHNEPPVPNSWKADGWEVALVDVSTSDKCEGYMLIASGSPR